MSKKIISLLIFTFFFLSKNNLCFSAKQNPPIEAKAFLNKNSLFIGERFTYTILIKTESDIEIEFPKDFLLNLKEFNIVNSGLSSKKFFKRKILKYWYILDTYLVGKYTIPAFAIKYRKKTDNLWKDLTINKIELEVKTLLTQDIKDIKDIKGPKKFPDSTYILFLAIGIFLIIVSVFFYFIFLKKQKKTILNPLLPPHIIAYQALAELEKNDYIKRGEFKIYYTELSEILRGYIQARFKIKALELTTEEFISKIKDDDTLPQEYKNPLKDFLSYCDLVKFAKYIPTEEDAILRFSFVKEFVDKTKEQQSI
ncbi:MAG: BatD family protein [Candidatus Omnitrophica bacterium]|nr:BatD family protein [Candidatus Omnitrophota bacterium]